MSSVTAARVFYCIDCGNRCRSMPLTIFATGISRGARPGRVLQLELCPPCKLAYWDQVVERHPRAARGHHEAHQRYARLKPADVEALATVKAWTSTHGAAVKRLA